MCWSFTDNVVYYIFKSVEKHSLVKNWSKMELKFRQNKTRQK